MATPLQQIIERIQQRTLGSGSPGMAIITGLYSGIMMVIMSVTYASFIFTGDLQPFVGAGVALALTSVIVSGFILTLMSSSAHLITQIDDDTAPVFGLFLAMLAASLPLGLSEAALFANLLAGIFIATAITSVVLLLFGLFRFGSFVQFVPYSVMGGYFAAVGWLLLTGAITMMSGSELESLADMRGLFESEVLMLWMPALLGGCLLKWLDSRMHTGLLLGGFVVLACLAFFGLHGLAGNSPQELLQQGHLIGPFAGEPRALISPVTQVAWQDVRQAVIFDNAGSIASITLISLLSIVLTVSGISITTRKDINANHELKVMGLANVGSSLAGGMLALPSLTISNLAYDLHHRPDRLIGFITVLFGLATFYFGMEIVAHTPKMVLGAMLVYIGLGFVSEWLIDGYKKFGAFEYSVIPIILLVSVFAGFLQSIVAGIVAAIVLFVIKYSRINIIRYQASGVDIRSNLVRDQTQNAILQKHGNQVRLFKLQGFLFFGTAGTLYRELLESVNKPENENLRYVILDFSQVIGADSSATLNFEKLAQRLAERKIFLIATSLREQVLEILRRGGLDLSNNAYLLQHGDLDQGLEWCENIILQEEGAKETISAGIFESIGRELSDTAQLRQLHKYLQRVEVNEGQALMRVGDSAEEVFFLESCTASAYIIDSRGQERRVSGAGRGAVYGEIGFFLGIPRTALVRADSEGEVFSLSRKSLNQMEHEAPELAAVIIRYLAKVVTERLVNTTQSLQAVL
ncbi:MAG: SLC26A/SulP transporter family protein [Gammaproteobacteria bacterium]|nr:SLC26A/SulP transporter family protein [Gammaproteobacteria bacterium]